MTATPNLNITHIVQSQAQKEVTANQALDDLDKATQGLVAHDASALGSPTEINVTAAQFVENFTHHVIGAAPATVFMYVPDGKRFFAVWNESGQNVVVDTMSGGSPAAALTVSDGGSQLIYSDGTTLIALGDSGTGGSFDIRAFLESAPTGSQILIKFVFTRSISFASGLSGSEGHLGTAATAQTDFDIKKNGASIGTCRFAASATTATFIFATDQTLVGGDRLSIVAPASPDATAADVSITLAGTKN